MHGSGQIVLLWWIPPLTSNVPRISLMERSRPIAAFLLRKRVGNRQTQKNEAARDDVRPQWVPHGKNPGDNEFAVYHRSDRRIWSSNVRKGPGRRRNPGWNLQDVSFGDQGATSCSIPVDTQKRKISIWLEHVGWYHFPKATEWCVESAGKSDC